MRILKYENLRKFIIEYYLELAEKTIEIATYEEDLAKAIEYIRKAEQLSNSNCIACLEKKKKVLLEIIKEMKKVI